MIIRFDFNKYINQHYFDRIGRGIYLKDEYITYLTFEQWKTFYNADSENWDFYHDVFHYTSKQNVYFPYYKHDNKYRVIIFPTKKEYKKFYKFFVKNIKNVYSRADNQKEIIEFAKIIEEKATLNIEEVQKKIAHDYKKVLNAPKEDMIQEYFNKNSEKKLESISKKFPYKVYLKKDTKTYINYYFNNNKSNIFCEYMNEFGHCYLLPAGWYYVLEEESYKDHTYCLVNDNASYANLDIYTMRYKRVTTWIDKCDIAEEYESI